MSIGINTQLYKDVSEALHQLFERKRLRAVARVHAKRQLEQGVAALRVLCDDLKSSGVDLNTVQGKAVLAMVLQKRMDRAQAARDRDIGYKSCIGEGFESE